jgi:glycosyltransferase involved in cell wall biosynthesis
MIPNKIRQVDIKLQRLLPSFICLFHPPCPLSHLGVARKSMASGVPVVVTHVGGLSEAVESGRGGILVGSRSPEEIARGVRQVAEDRALRERVVRHGRDRAARLFSRDRMLASLEGVYRQALNSR